MRTILVTGAAGSIGSELCRQLAPKANIVGLDINESGLYDLECDLGIKVYLCDITNWYSLASAINGIRPEVVIHAAAYKHVPMLERFRDMGYRVNVEGTRNLVEICEFCDVGQLIFISTDKAINPTSYMGQTKAWAEQVVLSSKLMSCVVRFGNVSDSRGSVLPLWRRQIASGGPVTVTHEDVTRYMMTVEDAVRLVLAASGLSKGGETYMVDMGAPVRMLDVARELIGDREIDIVFTGLRKGEKMHEEIVPDGYALENTEKEGVYKVVKLNG